MTTRGAGGVPFVESLPRYRGKNWPGDGHGSRSPPPPAPAMAQAHQPHLLGTAPKSFDRSADKAIAFWNTLENYYTTNAAIFDTDDKKILASLTHFKLSTQAGE